MTDGSPGCARCGLALTRGRVGNVCSVCLLVEILPAAEGLPDPNPTADLGQDQPWLLTFGPYELLEEIGRGGMGVIYKARQPGLDRVVALKMLLAGEFADVKARERLLREAKTAARLSHPGIVTIHEVGEHQSRPYFAMEYVPGRNLAQHCRDGLLPVATAVRYVEQLARAVHYAHQHGVLHRDLKPANVLISPNDEPKLTDFGLTKSLVDPTQTVESAGSPNFMAPEQADSTLGSTGTPTDIYGLGAILYYLLTGRPPAVGETLSETLRNVVAGEPVALRQLRPALPRDLETITLRCLEKEPSRRYTSAQDVADELIRWQRHEPIHARPATGPERLSKWVRRRPAIAALTAACALATILGFVGVTWQWRRTEVQRKLAEANEHTALRAAYFAEMTFADTAAEAGNWGAVRESLDRTRPAPGAPDLRGWEWRYLWHISRPGAQGRFGKRTHRIWSIAPLPDGKTVALGEAEGGFSLWDVTTGQLQFELPEAINQVRPPSLAGGTAVICRVAAVPHTTLLAYTEGVSEKEGWVHLWDTSSRATTRSLSLPGIPRDLAVSADGQWLACTLMLPNRRVLIFDVASGQLQSELECLPSNYWYPNVLAFSPDSRWLALPDARDRSVHVVEWRTGRLIYRLPLDQDFPLSMGFSPDGRWLATSAGFEVASPGIRVWDLETGSLRAELKDASRLVTLFDPTGGRLLTGQNVWRVPEFTLEQTLVGAPQEMSTAALLPDGDTYLTESGDAVLRWSLRAPAWNRGRQSPFTSVRTGTFLPDGQGLLVLTTQGTLERALAPRFEPEWIPVAVADATHIASLNPRPVLALAHTNGAVSTHWMDTWEETARWTADAAPCAHLIWDAPVGLLAYRTVDDRLKFWDPDRQIMHWEVPVLKGQALVGLTPDGRLHQLRIDGTLVSYDPRRREVLHQPLDHQRMNQFAFSPDGRWLVTTASEGPDSLRLVDARTWKTVRRLAAPGNGGILGSALWPKEPRLAVSGPRVLDLASGRSLLHLKSEFSFAPFVLLSEDGSIVVSIQPQQSKANLWWAPSWEQIRQSEADGSAWR